MYLFIAIKEHAFTKHRSHDISIWSQNSPKTQPLISAIPVAGLNRNISFCTFKQRQEFKVENPYTFKYVQSEQVGQLKTEIQAIYPTYLSATKS